MKRRQYAILAAAAAALFLSVFLFKRHLPYTGMPALPRKPPVAVMIMENAYLVGLGHKGKLWSVRAHRVEVAQNRTTTTLTGISHGSVFAGKAVAFSLEAGKAVYDSAFGNLILSGGIRVRGRDGQDIASDGALWSSSSAVLVTTGPVVCKNPWGKLTADRLQLNARRKELTLTRVGGSFDLKNAQDAFDTGVVGNAN